MVPLERRKQGDYPSGRIRALWMAGARNNPAEPTGTAHSGMDVHVHVHVHVCGRCEQISTNYRIKDEVDASSVRD